MAPRQGNGMTAYDKLRAQEIESFSEYEEVDNAAT